MGGFKKIATPIKGLYLIEPTILEDERGFFMESYNYKEFCAIGLGMNFVQDNHSSSQRGTLRGLHFQVEHPQGKLVRTIKGTVYDVAVDLRQGSDTYGEHYSVILSEENRRMFYIPGGFAHGFLALSDAEFTYKTTDYYYPEYEAGIIWNDQDIGIDWPFAEYGLSSSELIISDKDRRLPTLKEHTGGLK